MQLRQLEYLVSLAHERHFARAAIACRVSQPALSEGVRRLERELGVALIERDHAFHRMTPAGMKVVEWAKRMLADEQALHDEVAALRSELAGTLRLAAIPTAVSAIPGFVRPFSLAHPLASVEVSADVSASQILEGLSAFELDAGISYLDELPPEYRGVPLYHEHFCVAVPTDMIDRDWIQHGFPLDRLGDHPLVTLSARNRWRQMIDDALRRRGVVLEPTVESDSVGVLYSQVLGGGFAAIASREWARTFTLPAWITLVPLELGIEPTIGLVVRAESPSTPMVDAALDAARRFDRE